MPGEAYLGVDAGSTTVKTVLMGRRTAKLLLIPSTSQNSGNPVPIIREFSRCTLCTGSIPMSKSLQAPVPPAMAKRLLKNAFRVDFGIVETVAHFTAAKRFMPDVEFIIDIGGQDIKCFKIRNGAIDNIFLNEACSSGCGSFLQTFAKCPGLFH